MVLLTILTVTITSQSCLVECEIISSSISTANLNHRQTNEKEIRRIIKKKFKKKPHKS